MQEKRTDIVKVQGLVATSSAHQQLMKINRVLVAMVLFLMLTVVVLGFLFIPRADFDIAIKNTNISNFASTEVNSIRTADESKLQGQMVDLVSGSIESKLDNVEESIRSGAIDNALGVIATLKNDIKVLRVYSDMPKQELMVSNQDIVQEVSHLKKLIYITLGSCSLMFFAVAGVWVKSKRLPYKANKTVFLKKH